MTVKDIVKELQGLVNTGHGDEQLYVGWGAVPLSVQTYQKRDGSVAIEFKVVHDLVPEALLVAYTPLPQPQEQVKGKGDFRRAMDLLEQGFD